MADSTVKWGILGTGTIAATLAEAINASQTSELVAVGSRSQASADRFGEAWQVAHRHDSYEGVLADSDVDVVYISLPNHLHAPWSIACAKAGKHILCEKPMALNADEARTIIDAAREHDVFFMEAFMYRTHAQMPRLIELIQSGTLGEVRLIHASFGFNRSLDGDVRLYGPEKGGGGIMDVGCYTASICRLIAGAANGQPFAQPTALEGFAHLEEGGNDIWASATMKFDGDILATVACGMKCRTEWCAKVYGSEARVHIMSPWFPGNTERGYGFKLLRPDGSEQVISFEESRSVYTVEVDTVAKHLAARQAPAPCMSWADSIGNMEVLDAWRKSVGML